MYEKLRTHIENLFAGAPRTRRAEELKEELYTDLCAKYNDLLAKGKSEEEAFRIVIAGIGDVNELLRGLYPQYSDPEAEQRRRQAAAKTSLAVALYIASLIPVILLHNAAGAILMFLMWAAATGLLIYSHMTRPNYTRADDTVVEEFKEWKSGMDETRNLKRSINAALWPLIVVLYFIISFAFSAWAYSWLIFLLGVSAQRIISLLIDLRGDRHE